VDQGSDEGTIEYFVFAMVSDGILLSAFPVACDVVRGPFVRTWIKVQDASVGGTMEPQPIGENVVREFLAGAELVFGDTRNDDPNEPPLASYGPIHALNINRHRAIGYGFPGEMKSDPGDDAVLELAESLEERSYVVHR